MHDANVVQIFDTTLRDGEQSPGATMTQEEKIRIAQKLEQLGVDVIEAGFPAASPGEVRAVQALSQAVTNPQIAALCRTREGDIKAAWDALQYANHPRLHVFIATSDIHLKHKLKMSREEVLKQIEFGVSTCASYTDNVEFSAEDATRSDIGFLREAFACAIDNGARVLNVPDTVGYTMPQEYAYIVGEIMKVIDGRDVIISTHCHNDLGLAVANSLSAVAAGARQIECCVNGIGERAGNAALEEVVMALHTRKDLVGCQTNINTRHLLSTSRMVSDITGFAVQPNKAIVGRNAFAHESGIHQHGVLNERETYEIMAPEDVGFTESNLVLGKHSGRHALRDRLETLGYRVDDAQLKVIFRKFKELADKKKDIFDEDLHALFANTVLDVARHYELESVQFTSGSDVTPTATVSVSMGGQSVTGAATGDGPVNAAFEAIKSCTGRKDVALDDYSISAVTGGSDAQGRVYVGVTEDGRVAHGQSTHTDVVVASAEAFIDALNHLIYQRELERVAVESQATAEAP